VGGGGGFQTFCVEYNEHFYPGTTYWASISDRATYGSQYPTGDPISIGTAWLYSQFAAGTLGQSTPSPSDNYNYTSGSGRVASAGLLQQAIWFLEGETGGVDNLYVALARATLHLGNAGLQGDQGGAYEYGVRALNMWSSATTHNQSTAIQDQLVVVPEPTTIIAGALLLLPFGVSTLRILRKKRAA
jgi:hypothetical protein